MDVCMMMNTNHDRRGEPVITAIKNQVEAGDLLLDATGKPWVIAEEDILNPPELLAYEADSINRTPRQRMLHNLESPLLVVAREGTPVDILIG